MKSEKWKMENEGIWREEHERLVARGLTLPDRMLKIGWTQFCFVAHEIEDDLAFVRSVLSGAASLAERDSPFKRRRLLRGIDRQLVRSERTLPDSRCVGYEFFHDPWQCPESILPWMTFLVFPQEWVLRNLGYPTQVERLPLPMRHTLLVLERLFWTTHVCVVYVCDLARGRIAHKDFARAIRDHLDIQGPDLAELVRMENEKWKMENEAKAKVKGEDHAESQRRRGNPPCRGEEMEKER